MLWWGVTFLGLVGHGLPGRWQNPGLPCCLRYFYQRTSAVNCVEKYLVSYSSGDLFRMRLLYFDKTYHIVTVVVNF